MLEGSKNIFNQVCEFLYKKTAKGSGSVSEEGNRSDPPKGSSMGYGDRNTKTLYKKRFGWFLVEAVHVNWVSWGPTVDREGTRRSLTIFRGKKKVLVAACEGECTRKSFSYGDEKYLGAGSTPAGSWCKIYGSIPKKFLRENKK